MLRENTKTRHLSRRAFLGAAAGAAYAATRPASGFNVLFIPVDDLRPYLGCYGNRTAITPNIDRIASRGTVFTHAYCQQAICSASRSSLLTGRRPDTTRIYDLETHFRKYLPDVVTLPQQFRQNGYITTGVGKIYHSNLDDGPSWSIPAWQPGPHGWNSAANAAAFEQQQQRLKQGGWYFDARARDKEGKLVPRKPYPSWGSPDVPDNELPDGQIADAAVAALRQLKNDRFFLGAGFLKPHLPFVAPKRYFDLYRNTKFSLADNPFPPRGVPEIAMHNSGELRTYADIPQGPIEDEKALALIRAYYAAATYADAQIGRVVSELERLGLRDRTVIVLWGDHGYHLGDHGLWNKHTNFEAAVRSPLVVSVPGRGRRGARSNALVEFVDIFPFLCDVCGIPLPEGLEGTSFAPLLDAPARPWKKAAFSQYPRSAPGVGAIMGHSMRTDRYRFTEWADRDSKFREIELYDYERDPQENVNVAHEPGNAGLVARLTEMLHAGWKGALPV